MEPVFASFYTSYIYSKAYRVTLAASVPNIQRGLLRQHIEMDGRREDDRQCADSLLCL